jgi:hypothetical protein
VNVHPSKKIVHFSREELVVEKLAAQIKLLLHQSQGLRQLSFVSLPTSSDLMVSVFREKDQVNGEALIERKRKSGISLQPNKVIRVDHTERKIDEMYLSLSCECCKTDSGVSSSCSVNSRMKPLYCSETSTSGLLVPPPRFSDSAELLPDFDSCSSLVVKECSWVGLVDTSFSLLQFRSKLLLFNHALAFKQMFDRVCWEKGSSVTVLSFAYPPDFRLFLARSPRFVDTNLGASLNALILKSDLLMEYFKVGITEDFCLASFPILIDEVMPNPLFLPDFFAVLAYDCNWSSDIGWHETVCRALSNFFLESLLHSLQTDARSMEKRILPIVKQHFQPTKSFHERSGLIEVTSLEKLYKTFERC